MKEYQDSGYVLQYTNIVFVVVFRRVLMTAVIDTYVRLLQATTSHINYHTSLCRFPP